MVSHILSCCPCACPDCFTLDTGEKYPCKYWREKPYGHKQLVKCACVCTTIKVHLGSAENEPPCTCKWDGPLCWDPSDDCCISKPLISYYDPDIPGYRVNPGGFGCLGPDACNETFFFTYEWDKTEKQCYLRFNQNNVRKPVLCNAWKHKNPSEAVNDWGIIDFGTYKGCGGECRVWIECDCDRGPCGCCSDPIPKYMKVTIDNVQPDRDCDCCKKFNGEYVLRFTQNHCYHLDCYSRQWLAMPSNQCAYVFDGYLQRQGGGYIDPSYPPDCISSDPSELVHFMAFLYWHEVCKITVELFMDGIPPIAPYIAYQGCSQYDKCSRILFRQTSASDWGTCHTISNVPPVPSGATCVLNSATCRVEPYKGILPPSGY